MAGSPDSFAGIHVGSAREVKRRSGSPEVDIRLVADRQGSPCQLYPQTAFAGHVTKASRAPLSLRNGDAAEPGRRRATETFGG